MNKKKKLGGKMKKKIVYDILYMLKKRGFKKIRLNFRGIGRSKGELENGEGELQDEEREIEWVKEINKE